MKVCFSWLKEFVDIELSAQEIGDKLSMAGLVVESLEQQGEDWIFEFESLANRPDWLSVLGIAREISALTEKPLKFEAQQPQESDQSIESQASVQIDDSERCPRYMARIIDNIQVGPSPDWMVQRLEASGIRSINNVVDITNYVLLELGHPLHAFDYDLLAGAKIVVRRASEKSFQTLDGQKRELSAEDLVIADERQAVAIAGVMGGGNSEVSAKTQKVLLESAYFQPSTVRLTSKKLGLSSESSYRFERGADIDIVPVALNRAAQLLSELASGNVAQGVIDVYPQALEQHVVDVPLDSLNGILGTQLDAQACQSILQSLGFAVELETLNTMKVTVPNFRREVYRLEDVAEEVARIYGYENIPETLPGMALCCFQGDPMSELLNATEDFCVSLGLNQAIAYSFIHPKDQKELQEGSIALALPLSLEQSVMRRSLIPGLLKSLQRNISFGQKECRFFETGKIYFVPQGAGDESLDQHHEMHNLAALLTDDFYAAKGLVEELFVHWGLAGELRIVANGNIWSEKDQAADIFCGDQLVGYLGVLSKAKRKQFAIKDPKVLCSVIELELDALLEQVNLKAKYQKLPRFPEVQRDLALLLKEEIRYEQVLEQIESLKLPILKNVSFFDVYRGSQIPAGHKSLAMNLHFRDSERTLTDAEVDEAFANILKHMETQFSAGLREK